MKKIHPRLLNLIFLGLIFVLGFVGVFALRAELIWLVILAFLGVFVAAVLSVVFCRCPYCDAFYPRRGSWIGDSFCPACGGNVDEYFETLDRYED